MPNVTYECQICGRTDFKSYDECYRHEHTCQKTVYFKDDFSAEVISYKNTSKFDQENEIKKNQCHILKLDEIPQMGSKFESLKFEFYVSDDTLESIFKCLTDEAYERIFDEPRMVSQDVEKSA